MTFDVSAVVDAMPILMEGLSLTLLLVVSALAIGIAIGALGCFGRLLGEGPLYWLAYVYVGIFRGLPETVLIFWIYFCGPLILNVRLSALGSGILALSLVSGAYLTEIFRAGVNAVPRGQIEAARALGLPAYRRARHIIVPQALRVMLPTFIGFITILLKNSALISAIGVGELFYRAMTLSAMNYKYFEIYTAVGVVYFLLIFPLSMASRHAELRLGRAQR